jgi:pyruvate dehydrogenase E2 component (dihydrolipoamide acetyltransferase)
MALTKVVMPKTGAEMEEGRIMAWRRSEGERVRKGEVLLEIETDKAIMEVEAPESGILLKRLHAEGQTVPATRLIAVLGDGSEAAEQIGEFIQSENATPLPQPRPVSARTEILPPPSTLPGRGRIKASPLARRLAEEKGIDLASIAGTGPDGRIEKDDVLSAVDTRAAAAPSRDLVVPLSPMRRAIARRVAQSNQEVPAFSVTLSLDMTRALSRKKELQAAGILASINDLVVFGVSRVLASYPDLNAEFKGDSILRHGDINIGIVVGTEEGLYVPVIRAADKLSLEEIAAETERLTSLAQRKAITEKALTGGTFTITNLGMYGVDSFTAVILPSQTGILSVGSIVEKPVRGKNGELLWSSAMSVTLTVDHRAVDGLTAAKFLSDLKSLLQAL